MDELKRDLAEANRRLGSMVKRLAEVQEDVQGLRGTFASIETHLVKLFENEADAKLEREKIQEQWRDLAARVEALEKRTPPAA